jgi:superfamily II DNA/RNA helicase
MGLELEIYEKGSHHVRQDFQRRKFTKSYCTQRQDEMADEAATFAQFSHLISPLILRALEDHGFSRPTLVQQKAIPLALENHDVLARARTGSGKTAAYCIPLVQKILNAKAVAAVGALGAYLIVVQVLLSSHCSRALGRGRFAAAGHQGTNPRSYT